MENATCLTPNNRNAIKETHISDLHDRARALRGQIERRKTQRNGSVKGYKTLLFAIENTLNIQEISTKTFDKDKELSSEELVELNNHRLKLMADGKQILPTAAISPSEIARIG